MAGLLTHESAVLAALGESPQLDSFSSEVFIDELQGQAKEGDANGIRAITLGQLRKLQASAKPAMKHLIGEIIRKRGPPLYNKTGKVSVDGLESIIRWFDRKSAHRTMLVNFARNLDIISKDQFTDYLRHEIIPLLPSQFTTNNFFEVLFCIICCEGVFTSIRTVEGTAAEKAKIQHILATTMMDEIDEGVHQSHPETPQPLFLNWFSVDNHSRIYREFKEINDPTSPNFITLENLLQYNDGLSEIFVKGFWQNATLFPVERTDAAKETAIDIRGFIKFQRLIFNVTTVNRYNQGQPKAEYMHVLQLIFRCLCPPNENVWSPEHFELIVRSLLKAIFRVDKDFGKELTFSGLFQQMQDFIQPADRSRISFADFVNLDKYVSSGQPSQAALCLGCLIDGKKYYEYDSREGQ